MSENPLTNADSLDAMSKQELLAENARLRKLLDAAKRCNDLLFQMWIGRVRLDSSQGQKMIEYPSEICLIDCARRIVDIVVNKDFSVRKAELAHSVWNVQGYVQSVVLGEVVYPVGRNYDVDDAIKDLFRLVNDDLPVELKDQGAGWISLSLYLIRLLRELMIREE